MTIHVGQLRETLDNHEDNPVRYMALNTSRRLWVADSVRHLHTVWFQRYERVALQLTLQTK